MGEKLTFFAPPMRPDMVALLPLPVTLRDRARELRVRRLHQLDAMRTQHPIQRLLRHTRVGVSLFQRPFTRQHTRCRRCVIQREDDRLHAFLGLGVEHEVCLPRLLVRHAHAERLLDLVGSQSILRLVRGLIDKSDRLSGRIARVGRQVQLQLLPHGDLKADVFAGEDGLRALQGCAGGANRRGLIRYLTAAVVEFALLRRRGDEAGALASRVQDILRDVFEQARECSVLGDGDMYALLQFGVVKGGRDLSGKGDFAIGHLIRVQGGEAGHCGSSILYTLLSLEKCFE